MKIFTDALQVNDKFVVNTILIGDKEQIYLNATSLVGVTNKDDALLLGIQRAILFQRNMKPLHCNGEVIIFNDQIKYEKLRNDKLVREYVSNPLQIKSAQDEKDLYHSQLSKTQIDIYARDIRIQMMNDNIYG